MASAPALFAAAMSAAPFRYPSVPGSCTRASASATCGASASGSVYTATVPSPSRRHVAKTRRAISDRLATRTLLIIAASHPEDTEVRRALDWRIGDGRQAHSQHGAGVARIDHPV